MATVTGLTAERMLEIEAESVVDGEIVGDHLLLTRHDGTQIDAGVVVGPQGPQGPTGADGTPGVYIGQIIEMSGGNPDATKFVACDGASYLKTAYPLLDAYYSASSYPHGSDATHFNVPDRRERVGIGTSAGTPLGTTDGVTLANRSGRRTKHRHSLHSHGPTAGQFVQGTLQSGTAGGGPIQGGLSGGNTTANADGGSGNVNDPLDGPAFLASNFYVRAA